MVCAMPNTNPAITSRESLELAEDLYKKKAVCDYGLYLGASADNSVLLPELAARSCGLKMYLNETFNALKMDQLSYVRQHFEQWPKNKPICCHAEQLPLAAVLFFAELYERHVHICHVATKDDMLLIKLAKERGIRVTCEVTAHHLFFSNKDLPLLSDDMKEVRPSLKSEEDRLALWSLFAWIDCIASDHAPHTLDEKRAPTKAPGFPGLETTLPLLITAHKQGKLTIGQIVEKCYTNPKKIFNLPEQLDTYIEVDLDAEWTLPEAMPHSKCKWNPFRGVKVYFKTKNK